MMCAAVLASSYRKVKELELIDQDFDEHFQTAKDVIPNVEYRCMDEANDAS